MIMKPLILVTGATGATGSFTTRELLKRGFSVRAYVHSNDERSRELESLGAEIFVGDLLDFRAIRHAFEGVQRAYFVYPLRPGLTQATAQFAQAALEAKAEFIVNVSQKCPVRTRRVSRRFSTGSPSRYLIGRERPWHTSAPLISPNGICVYRI